MWIVPDSVCPEQPDRTQNAMFVDGNGDGDASRQPRQQQGSLKIGPSPPQRVIVTEPKETASGLRLRLRLRQRRTCW